MTEKSYPRFGGLLSQFDFGCGQQGSGWVALINASWLARPRCMGSLWNAPASLISGGQVRRVGLARMLARKPQLVLLDEPFTGLDRQLTRELIDDLVFWNQTLGFTMIAVDHEAEVLRRLCPGQATVIENGKVVQRGIWEDLYCALATPLLRSLLAPL